MSTQAGNRRPCAPSRYRFRLMLSRLLASRLSNGSFCLRFSMRKVAVFLFVVLCTLNGAAQTPPPPASPNPWTVSVIHTVDFQKLVEWMKHQGNERIAVPASPPAYVYNFATGLVIDDQGHVITRLVNLTPFDKEPINKVTTADGAAHRARLVGMDGATGFALLEVAALKSGMPKGAP